MTAVHALGVFVFVLRPVTESRAVPSGRSMPRANGQLTSPVRSGNGTEQRDVGVQNVMNDHSDGTAPATEPRAVAVPLDGGVAVPVARNEQPHGTRRPCGRYGGHGHRGVRPAAHAAGERECAPR
ncbi:hypothetical protein K373_00889 [Streptomyces sp. DvalAA-21]|nr:hypothetical protein SACTE_0113 [Streptomyces sp. SirexAA-E]PZX42400.1 hypothetical protein K373_00889 [Streptomyces sp. DvalAA-21]RAJ39569.1 hypothetical protein K351_01211 [Streptomyces sp. DpondAA-E10]RAJ53530.1 hypothetical protein K352_00607 [Streptomyces sp. DpondAA-A50]SCE19705.1 hypothetical protein GA0115235_113634 [Streptomyces sp. DpondAA-F4a]SCM10918.1 hypothetical protein SAMN04883147_1077220 [Streptomyces sp. DpondAA-F4]